MKRLLSFFLSSIVLSVSPVFAQTGPFSFDLKKNPADVYDYCRSLGISGEDLGLGTFEIKKYDREYIWCNSAPKPDKVYSETYSIEYIDELGICSVSTFIHADEGQSIENLARQLETHISNRYGIPSTIKIFTEEEGWARKEYYWWIGDAIDEVYEIRFDYDETNIYEDSIVISVNFNILGSLCKELR